MSQQYSLRWNNHQPNFISMFTTHLNTQTLVDVTLAAEGKHLQAHKLVLSACSTFFNALFLENPTQHPIVIIKGVTFADLRTMVDFMYYGEVNVTEEQLPQVLETAKLLKIKGLTEMPESTLTRAQGAGAQPQDFASPSEPADSQRMSTPASSPSNKRRRRLKSSPSSPSLNMVSEEARSEEQTVELVRDGITLSSVPQRRREFHEDRHHESQQQPQENQHMNMNTLGAENPGIAQESEASSKRRLRRQRRVPEEGVRRQVSEPAFVFHTSPAPALRKNASCPTYDQTSAESASLREEHECKMRIARNEKWRTESAPVERGEESEARCSTRASHTPIVRAGPPLSCNYCWNTVDESGRILRRKTQYHCPECGTNLCIVPCFHKYHDREDPFARGPLAN